jgi:hypothetical protein
MNGKVSTGVKPKFKPITKEEKEHYGRKVLNEELTVKQVENLLKENHQNAKPRTIRDWKAKVKNGDYFHKGRGKPPVLGQTQLEQWIKSIADGKGLRHSLSPEETKIAFNEQIKNTQISRGRNQLSVLRVKKTKKKTGKENYDVLYSGCHASTYQKYYAKYCNRPVSGNLKTIVRIQNEADIRNWLTWAGVLRAASFGADGQQFPAR